MDGAAAALLCSRTMESPFYSSSNARRAAGFLRDLLRSRELLLNLILKDIRVRYRYTAVGMLWAVLEPLALMAVLAFVFATVLGDRAGFAQAPGGAPYSVFLLTGLVFWQFTANALTHAAAAILDNRNLVQKVRFPREVLPLSALGYPMLNWAIGFVLLLGLHLLLGGSLGPGVALMPFVFVLQLTMTAGLALLLACGNVHYRDVGYILAVALMLGFYATPILYPSALLEGASLPEWVRQAYFLNPMAGFIETYRALLFGHPVSPAMVAWPALASMLSVLAGVAVFRRAAPTLSDHL
jgi:ABC-type polysaccharide/polyol phosphate export permease